MVASPRLPLIKVSTHSEWDRRRFRISAIFVESSSVNPSRGPLIDDSVSGSSGEREGGLAMSRRKKAFNAGKNTIRLPL
ncbi:hypothetical protein D3C81_1277240 [compost metagenome]